MKVKFRDTALNKKSQLLLNAINVIIADYEEQGYVLTLRQLYYQLVTKNIILNKDTEYKKLGRLLKEGRMAGIVDWSAIEDRVRQPYVPYWVTGVENAIKDTIRQYRLDRMKTQDVYIEVWVEKDALSGVLKRITEKYHIKLMVNRGYSSASAMYDSYKRFIKQLRKGKEVYILYLGDHDPSGLDMIRDINDRIKEMLQKDVDFEGDDYISDFNVNQIGLNMEQIKMFNPPPNPAKIKDPRAKWYIQQYGPVSWEVDALNPKTLNKLLEDSILELIDIDLYEDILSQEEEHKEKLEKIKNLI